MSELYNTNIEIARNMIEMKDAQKSKDDGAKSAFQKNILENNPHKLALQIDNDLRESLPPQMMAVISGVLNMLGDIAQV